MRWVIRTAAATATTPLLTKIARTAVKNAVKMIFHLRSRSALPMACSNIELDMPQALGMAERHINIKIGIAATHCSPKTMGT